jgi:addiction module HigA family antidote
VIANKWNHLLRKFPLIRRAESAPSTPSRPSSARLPIHRPTHPGEILLQEFLKPLSISPTIFARRIRVSPGRIMRLIHGEDTISADLALRLARVLGTSAEFWLNLQQSWDVWHAMRSPQGKGIARLRPIRLPRSEKVSRK